MVAVSASIKLLRVSSFFQDGMTRVSLYLFSTFQLLVLDNMKFLVGDSALYAIGAGFLVFTM